MTVSCVEVDVKGVVSFRSTDELQKCECNLYLV